MKQLIKEKENPELKQAVHRIKTDLVSYQICCKRTDQMEDIDEL